MKDYSELGRYIVALCEANHFSLRRASLEAGLEASTIHKILERDGLSVPTPETLEKLASGLGGDFFHMMRMAGHLPPTTVPETEDAELYAKIQRLQHLVREVSKRDPAAARRLMGLVITPFEVMLALKEEESVEEAARNGEAMD